MIDLDRLLNVVNVRSVFQSVAYSSVNTEDPVLNKGGQRQ